MMKEIHIHTILAYCRTHIPKLLCIYQATEIVRIIQTIVTSKATNTCHLLRYIYTGCGDIKPKANYILKSLCMNSVRLYVSFLTRRFRA